MSTAHMESLHQERERTVRAHIEAERRGDWSAALATFHVPRYEIMATGEVHASEAGVMAFYVESARGFADIGFETRGLHRAGEVVIHELVFSAMHRGPWRGLPPTGRVVRYPMLNVFVFEEERLVCERMYFDLLTPLRQLGIARDPMSWSGRVATAFNHPCVIARALLRSMLPVDRRALP